MSRMSSKDFRDHLPSAIGEQTRINHTNCPAGEDTRQRLYIKRESETLYVAYCHNCTKWGALKVVEGSSWKYVNPRLTTVDTLLTPEPVPPDLIDLNSSWAADSKALKYVRKYLDKLGGVFRIIDKIVFYSPSLKRIVYHIKDGDNSFWQARDCSGVLKNKYYTGKNQNKNAIVISNGVDKDVCVITEDIMSSIMVASTEKVDAIPLLGTTPANFPQLVEKLSKYKKVIVWLDNDEAGGKGSIELTQRLQMLGSFLVAQVFTSNDPKEYDLNEITTHLSPYTGTS